MPITIVMLRDALVYRITVDVTPLALSKHNLHGKGVQVEMLAGWQWGDGP
ncbi:MAG: hypothetical protein H0W72_02505 [Planctomycetes bacterium]|nr:hypothetical protein [Planctomycetota bacterium]